MAGWEALQQGAPDPFFPDQRFDGHYLAVELAEALDDPRRGEWGGYPWEHLGDAERDVRILLTYIKNLERNQRTGQIIHGDAES